jgi:CheY-like chemotaxis protein
MVVICKAAGVASSGRSWGAGKIDKRSLSMRTDRQPAARPQRVLIAEDSSVTQDLLKLLLSQRGHEVDIVSDGETALERLCKQTYDVALLDFHLPRLSGLKVVKSFLAQRGSAPRPRLIAITADVEGLLADEDNCEQFDEIIPKPLDIYAVSKLVEAQTPPQRGASPEERPEAAASGSVRGRDSLHAAHPVDQLGFSFLHWPEDFRPKRLAARNLHAEVSEARLDAILLHETADETLPAAIWRFNPLHLLPVIDLTGKCGAGADINAANISCEALEKVKTLLADFREQSARVHPDFWRTDELGDKLLARIAARGGSLPALYAPHTRNFAAHPAPLDEDMLIGEVQKLRASGFLTAAFFDRFYACPHCGGSRLNVREECAQCHSANLSEEPYLHHFQCAYQGPEKDFRRGEALICPKCGKPLAHFSVDYDKPGSFAVCNGCGHAASESKIAFVCIDCGTHAATDIMPTRDVFSYELTDRARAFLEAGRIYLGRAQRSLRFTDLPLDLVVALNAEARRYNEDRTPFALLNIGYQNARTIEREYGPRQFSQARDLFLENLRNALGDNAHFVKGHFYDFALLKGAHHDGVASRLDNLSIAAAQPLRFDLGVAIQAFGPEDFA